MLQRIRVPLVGLCGRMGAGKDEAAAYLLSRDRAGGGRAQLLRLSDPVRVTASLLSGNVPDAPKNAPVAWARLLGPGFRDRAEDALRYMFAASGRLQFFGSAPFDQLDRQLWWLLAQHRALGRPRTFGALLQVVGTDFGRGELGADVWLDAALARWRRLGSPPAVVPDVRFPNEVDAIRRGGGLVFRVDRSKGGRADGRDAAHASETALADVMVDGVVHNGGSLADLHQCITASVWPRIAGLPPQDSTTSLRPVVTAPAITLAAGC